MSSFAGRHGVGDPRDFTASDAELARQLQREFDGDGDGDNGGGGGGGGGGGHLDDGVFVAPPTIVRRRAGGGGKRPLSCSADDDDDDPLNATQNLVHPDWETRDPTPDIQSLFRAFDAKFFQQRLRCVSLEWSRRMYQCAGICYYRRNRMGTSITIRLSEPLLKLRQRKDLVETLLHEMIHAYLFVLNIREPNGGHGPNFRRIMVSINQTTGTNITVYHTFHDEVNAYRTHVWKCNGLCQHRQPFYGVVKRTCNRAPGPNDLWWAQHQQTCGGYFKKISEPEKKAKATKKPPPAASGPTAKRPRQTGVRGLDDANNVPRQRIDDPKWGMRPTNQPPPTVPMVAPPAVPAKRAAPATASVSAGAGGRSGNVRGFGDLTAGSDGDEDGGERPQRRPATAAGGNLRNVVGFRDLNEAGGSGGASQPRAVPSMSGSGYTLGGSSGGSGGSVSGGPSGSASQYAVVDLVRGVWDRKFGNTAVPAPKKGPYTAIASTSKWQQVGGDADDDDDVLINDHQNEIIELHSDDSDDDQLADRKAPTGIRPAPALTQDQRQHRIKAEIFDDDDDQDRTDGDRDDSDIILIDDEFDDSLMEAADAAETADRHRRPTALDHSVIDDIFGTDTLLADFATINDAMPDASADAEIITCPICAERMARGDLPEHLNGCLGIRKNVVMPGTSAARSESGDGGPQSAIKWKPPSAKKRPVKQERRTLDGMSPSTSAATRGQPAVPEPERTACPSCWRQIALADINAHLDECLS